MAGNDAELDNAIETFVRGYCVGKSATQPYECRREGDLWVMRDAPRRNARYYRKEEWVAYGVEARLVDSAARKQTRGRFFVSAIIAEGEADEPLRAEYKRLGYRLLVREAFFVHRLKRIPRPPAPVSIERVRTEELAARLGKTTRSRPIPAACFGNDGSFRQYAAVEGNAIVGWVRSVTAGDATWCADMAVVASHRRRGIGRAMLAKMLRDDRALRARQSALLASKAGALLYPHVGYEQIGTLFILAPMKK